MCRDGANNKHIFYAEPLPWRSTISRTRQLYGDEVFLELFRKVLSLCVEKGMDKMSIFRKATLEKL